MINAREIKARRFIAELLPVVNGSYESHWQPVLYQNFSIVAWSAFFLVLAYLLQSSVSFWLALSIGLRKGLGT